MLTGWNDWNPIYLKKKKNPTRYGIAWANLRYLLIKGVIKMKIACPSVPRRNYIEICSRKACEMKFGIGYCVPNLGRSGILFLQGYWGYDSLLNFQNVLRYWWKVQSWTRKSLIISSQETFGSVSGVIDRMTTELWKTQFSLLGWIPHKWDGDFNPCCLHGLTGGLWGSMINTDEHIQKLFTVKLSVKKYMSFHIDWIRKVAVSPGCYSYDFVPDSVTLFCRENGRFL